MFISDIMDEVNRILDNQHFWQYDGNAVMFKRMGGELGMVLSATKPKPIMLTHIWSPQELSYCHDEGRTKIEMQMEVRLRELRKAGVYGT